MTDVEHRQGCPATGGYGHGVEPCTCGAITGPELLPLPKWLLEGFTDPTIERLCDYARANVAHATEALRAELREAWSAVDSKAGWEWKKRAEQAEARAERLAEALRLIAAPMRSDGSWNRDREACRQIAKAALREHDQEVGNG